MGLLAAGLAFTVAVLVPGAASGKPPERLNKADGRLASRLTLRLNDLPAGWHVENLSSGRGGKCATPRTFPKGVVLTGKAQSSFATGQIRLALSFAAVVSTVPGSEATFTLLRQFLPDCLRTAGQHVGKDVTVSAMSFPSVGDQSTALEMQATISGTVIYFDAVIVRVRRAVAAYIFGGIEPAEARQEVALVRRAVERA